MIAIVQKVKRLLFSDASLLRWTFFSVFSFVMVLGLTALLHEVLHFNEKISFLIPLVTVFVTNFVTMRYFVYGKPTESIPKQFLGYVFSSVGFRAFEYAAYWILLDWLQIYYIAAASIIMPISFLSKFFFYKVVIFGPKSRKSHYRTKV